MRRLMLAMAAGIGLLAAPALADHHASDTAKEPACDLAPREVVEAFIPLFYEQKNATEAFARWVRPDYIQHNPAAPDGAAAAVGFLQPFFDANPDMRYTVHRVIADGELVAVHNHLQMNADDRGSAVVDIFRVEGCRIAEHWDVIQPVPETSANDNTMF